MVGENFEIYLSRMAKHLLKLPNMVVEKFEIFLSQMAKHALKLSTMVGEKFEFHLQKMAKNELIHHGCGMERYGEDSLFNLTSRRTITVQFTHLFSD